MAKITIYHYETLAEDKVVSSDNRLSKLGEETKLYDDTNKN
jgi:hypothetical protein